jgi:hypothetical protein
MLSYLIASFVRQIKTTEELKVTKNHWKQYPVDSPERIVAHAEYRQKRGKRPSMAWMEMGVHSPRFALELAGYESTRMNQSQALEYATEIARLLVQGATRINKTSVGHLSILARLSVSRAAQLQDVQGLDPSFQEIIVFGSAAREGSMPEDIDMMIFDTGFYSRVLCKQQPYGSLKGNLQRLALWFDREFENHDYEDVLVDLLLFPLSVLEEASMRRVACREQKDPDFFKNAMSDIYRFDFEKGEFVKTDITYFEAKYCIDLAEFRNDSAVDA